ncbi:MAG TPA: GNAT family N-acetyltransferase [Acidimicrobiales bacterium]|nr:GNAT family N-acetyltransferase [Acidimicrobiales bacterium]
MATGPAPTGAEPAPYPAELERDVRTADGSAYRVRPIRPDDAERLVAFHRGLSSRSTYFRFFRFHPTLTADEVDRFTHVDYRDRLALVAERDGRLLGVGRFDRTAAGTAEVAFVVTDAYQHHGIATCLLDGLIAAALPRGIEVFTAEVLAENTDMLDVFCDTALPVAVAYDADVASVRFPIQPTPAYLEGLGEREAIRRGDR